MSSARLEVITDDDNVAPRISRTLPAALYGDVNVDSFQTFCDRMDGLFDQLDAEQRRRKKRFWWMYGAINIWAIIFFIFLPMYTNFPVYDNSYSIIFYLVAALMPFCLCVICMCTIWGCTAPPNGAKSDAETMRDIRLECEEMTTRTPGVSFHVVLMPVPSGARGAWLQMNTIDHIAVSIASLTSVHGAIGAMAVKHDGAVEATIGSRKPVVYAKAVADGDYQQLV